MDGHVVCNTPDPLPKLFPLGINLADTVAQDTPGAPHTIELQPGQLARDWQQDYLLFTPALMYTTVPWPVDPWLSFVSETNQDLRPSILVSGKPLLRGHTLFWGHHLQLLDRAWGEAAIQYFGTLALHNPVANTLFRVRSQQIHIVEPYAVDPAQVYTTVTALVVESNKGCSYYVQREVDGVIWAEAIFNPDLVFSDTLNFQLALTKSQNPYEGG